MGDRLSDEQRDGSACIRCGRDDRPMVPVGILDGVQIFACTICQ